GSTQDGLSGTATIGNLVSGESLALVNDTYGTLASANAGLEGVSANITLANGSNGLASNYTLAAQPDLGTVTVSSVVTVTGADAIGYLVQIEPISAEVTSPVFMVPLEAGVCATGMAGCVNVTVEDGGVNIGGTTPDIGAPSFWLGSAIPEAFFGPRQTTITPKQSLD
ncbi:hypothetical protein, partial [Acidocella sp.]|uniref:hypothetical protein n=1 Tax=Acidocella sp. TaxID=50710 RepID=UPI002604FE80